METRRIYAQHKFVEGTMKDLIHIQITCNNSFHKYEQEKREWGIAIDSLKRPQKFQGFLMNENGIYYYVSVNLICFVPLTRKIFKYAKSENIKIFNAWCRKREGDEDVIDVPLKEEKTNRLKWVAIVLPKKIITSNALPSQTTHNLKYHPGMLIDVKRKKYLRYIGFEYIAELGTPKEAGLEEDDLIETNIFD